MTDDMNTEQSDRYELFARFYEIQRAIDKLSNDSSPDERTMKLMSEQKEELISRLETR